MNALTLSVVPTKTVSNDGISTSRKLKPWLTGTDIGHRCLQLTESAAQTPLSIYLSGETGTGKDVLAHWVHEWSPRRSGPFVPLHCAAISAALAESELFGHVRGAFTGAATDRPGALIQAHGGTLFLDEIGDLSMDLQIKLLRFLENGEIKPVGSDRMRRADTRIVCATHQPLEKLVTRGKFRKDLYYRIASVKIELPPLRMRLEDIPLLAEPLLSAANKSLSDSALRHLLRMPWEGNVRELLHAIHRALAFCPKNRQTLEAEDFTFLSAESFDEIWDSGASAPGQTLEQMEKVMILRALKASRGHRVIASKHLGIARSTLYDKMQRYQIQTPDEGSFWD